MATTKTVQESEAPVAKTEEKSQSKTHTNWRLFEEFGFIPVSIKCDGYKSNHPSDLSCHTNIVPSAENVVRHSNPEHGGGWFKVRFKVSDTKKSTLWKGLEDAGVELREFYCPHCGEQVPVEGRRILFHLNYHPGRNRVNLLPQTLCMSLGPDPGTMPEDEGLYI